MTAPVAVRSPAAPERAIPKSVRTAWPSRERTRMLPGLMSRWMTPWSWACWSASATEAMIGITSAAARAPRSAIRSARERPSMYSMTR